MNFKIFQLCFLGLLLNVSCQNNKDCSAVKDGKYYIIEPDGSKIRIERKGSSQIEYSKNDSIITEYKVMWTSKCEYELIYNKMIKGKEWIPTKFNGDVLKVEIIDISDSSYRTKSQFINLGYKMEHEIFFENE